MNAQSVLTVDGIEWSTDGKKFITTIDHYTLIVQGVITNKSNASKNWDWLAEIDGRDIAGENNYCYRQDAMRAAIHFAKRNFS